MNAVALLPVLLTAAVFGQSPYDGAKAAMDARTTADRATAAGDADKRAWPYVVADKKAKTVTVLACGTAIKPTDPVEFFLTTVASGKDYEALAVTFATPGDVKAALEFVGLRPGEPLDPAADRFWNKGPRVVMTFTAADAKAVRAEATVTNTDTNRPLPADGLMFTGSAGVPAADGEPHADTPNGFTPPADARRVADGTPDGLIASVYNEPRAVLDVPHRATQAAVYGRRRPSGAWAVAPGGLVDVTLAPAVGRDSVIGKRTEIGLSIGPDGKTRYARGATTDSPAPETPDKTGTDVKAVDLPTLIDGIAKDLDGNIDLFVTVFTRGGVPVVDLRKLYAVLDAVQQDRGVKIDAPTDNGLAYRAFFPDPAWRDRAARLGEPWDLFLTRAANGNLSARLERQTEIPDAVPPTRLESHAVADPAALAARVKADGSRWSRTLFVYPPADLTCVELLEWRNAVRTDVPNVYVFPPDGPAK